MRKFTLLLNGKDLDTGIYEYYPYMDKVITDFRGTYRIITQLKLGQLAEESPEAREYIYAKYCVGRDDTNLKAIEAAHNASKTFRYMPLSIRRKILGDMHKNLLENKEELLKMFIVEGHPRRLAEWEFSGMEKGCRDESLDFFKKELWKEIGRIGGETMYWARKPDGVVCVSPPRNASASSSLIASYALLSGNALVIKPPLRMPLSTLFLWKEIVGEALRSNSAPDGTLNILVGNSSKISREWLESPYVNDILYFGKSENGLLLAEEIMRAGKKPILELSGNDMMFVWKDGDLKGSISALMDAFLGSTQICMVPKAAIVHNDIYEQFTNEFVRQVKKMKVGLPSDPETCFSPVALADSFFIFLDDALTKGAELLFGGNRINYKGLKDDKGVYLQPTVISIDEYKKAFDMLCIKEENFFPLLPVVRVKGSSDKAIFEAMMDFANSNEYGLRTSVWAKSNLYIRKFVRHINNSGLLRINSRHVDFSSYLSTHGGTGRSGGPYGEMNYVWQKTSHLQGISLTRDI